MKQALTIVIVAIMCLSVQHASALNNVYTSEGRAEFNSGCTDITACNYDVNATVDDGSCEYTSCAGCTDQLACNYDASKLKNDNSCEFADDPCETCSWSGSANPADGSGTVVTDDSDGDGICDTYDDCTDTSKCNYDANPTEACVDPVEYYHDEDGDNIGDYSLGTFCEGVDDIPERSTPNLESGNLDRCIDTNACNYNSSQNEDCQGDQDNDGICDGLCNPDDNLDCSQDNCVDTSKPNYDSSSNESCCADSNGNTICDDREIFGCTDLYACNYFEYANIDDGTCEFHTSTTSSSSNTDSQYSLSLEDNQCDSCTPNDSTVSVLLSVAELVTDTNGDAISTLGTQTTNSDGVAIVQFTIGRYASNDEDGNDVCDTQEQVGCNDPTACNYGLDASDSQYPQALDSSGDPMFDDVDGDGTDDILYITRPCSKEDGETYGVTPLGDECTNYCRYNDACGNCDGTGVDVDGDGACDDGTDLCVDLLACNYNADTDGDGVYEPENNVACKYLNECDVCSAGTDADNNGYVDGDDSDSDDDGICDDGTDLCTDTNACNYNDESNLACLYLNQCDVCTSGVDADGDGYIDADTSDSDGDGVCDDIDNCTDTSACNYDQSIYPNIPCLVDTDDDDVCDVHEIEGCTDSTACNYNASATDANDDLCEFADEACESCSGDNHDGSDYVIVADVDHDGVCDSIDLCQDILACNYNANPTEPCGTDTDGNGVCEDDEHNGCMDSTACNYRAIATRDPSGSCVYPTGCQVCAGSQTDGTGYVENADADFDGICSTIDLCENTAACNYIAAIYGNVECVLPLANKNCEGYCINDIDLDGICDEDDDCTDLTACNYDDPAATSCIERDECGVCGGSGIPAGACDCEGNTKDALLDCGGTCEADVDGDGICDDIDPCLVAGEEPDECGVCNGPGLAYECGCFDLPEDACSCETNGAVTYPALGEDCDGFCLYDSTMVEINGVLTQVCTFYDNAEPTVLPSDVITSRQAGNQMNISLDFYKLYEWMHKVDSLHSRMSENLDDGSLSGASKNLTIEESILNKGDLTVRGESRLSGDVQMDGDLVVLQNIVIEGDATIKGTTFADGGIETTSLDMAGDLSVGGSAVIDSTLDVRMQTTLHDTLTVYGDLLVGRNHVFTVDTLGNATINGNSVLAGELEVQGASRLSSLTAGSTDVSDLTSQGLAEFKNNILVDGGSTLKGALQVNNSANVSGQLQVDGNTVLNDKLSVGSTSDEKDAEISGQLSSKSIVNKTLLTTSTAAVTNSLTTPVLSVTQTADVIGRLTVSDVNSDTLFTVKSGNGLALANLPGDLKIYSSSTAYSTNPGAPNITLSSTGLITSLNQISGSSFSATSAITPSVFKQVDIGGSAVLRKGLTVEYQEGTTTANALTVDATNGKITLNGTTDLNSDLTIAAGKTLNVGSSTGTASSVNVYGALTTSGHMHSATLSLGSASQVAGNGASNDGTGSLIAGNTSIHGNLTIRQIGSTNTNFRSQGKMVVGSKSDDTNPPGGHMAYFDGSTAGLNSSSGIAISLNSSHPNNDNHYVTFYKNSLNDKVAGRIEGQTEADWTNNNALKLDSDEHIQAVTMAWLGVAQSVKDMSAETAIAIMDALIAVAHIIPDSWTAFFPNSDWGNLPASIANAVLSSVYAAFKASDVVIATAEAVTETQNLERFNAILADEEQKGVAYATGHGDYAEWMPRVNLKEDISARQIVGIKDGAVSLRTDDFDHLMVISTAPAVLGAMPAEEKIHGYEKVAFMGQVPVDVIGPVHSGDFIIPSGDHDGFGIAVDPAEISAGQVNQIVGVAWETETSSFIKTINVAVGLSNNASTSLISSFEEELDDFAIEVRELKQLIENNHAGFADYGSGAKKRFRKPATSTKTRNQAKPNLSPKSETAPVVGAHAVGAEIPTNKVLVHSAMEATPEFHKKQMEKFDSNDSKAQYYANFTESLASSLSGVSSMDDLNKIVAGLGEGRTTGISLLQRTAPYHEALADLFAQELFTTERIREIVRKQLSKPEYSQYRARYSGAKAEQALVQKVESIIAKSLEDSKGKALH